MPAPMTRLTTGLALDLITDPRVIYRFMAKVQRSVATGTCWNWTGALRHDNKDGIPTYGVFRLGARGASSIHAHRVAYAIFIGALPEGFDVHHECARALCVNPQHLALLTRSANAHEVNERTARAHRAALDEVPF